MRSYDASTHTDLPIPYAGLAALIGHLEHHCSGIVVVGAVARDLLACAAGDLPITRATRDVDLGVALQATGPKAELGDLRPARTVPTYTYGDLVVDVTPYGPVEDEQRRVLLPGDFQLDTTGIAEAARHAVAVTIPGGAVIPVAPLEAQSVLKLLAWRDRGTSQHREDAQDLGTILRAASSGVYAARLYDDEALLDLHDYDVDSVGCHLLGRSAAALLDPAAREATRAVVTTSEQCDRLTRAMDGLPQENRRRLDAGIAGFTTAS